jgi:Uncharacterized conserved protein
MNKLELVRSEMIKAMKEKNKERKDSLSALLGVLKNAEIDKKAALNEDEANAIIKKEIKQTQETYDTAPETRDDIRLEASIRLEIFKEFVPKDMSAEQIDDIITKVLDVLEIVSPEIKDKGRIMKELIPRVKGKADGKLVNELLGKRFNS